MQFFNHQKGPSGFNVSRFLLRKIWDCLSYYRFFGYNLAGQKTSQQDTKCCQLFCPQDRSWKMLSSNPDRGMTSLSAVTYGLTNCSLKENYSSFTSSGKWNFLRAKILYMTWNITLKAFESISKILHVNSNARQCLCVCCEGYFWLLNQRDGWQTRWIAPTKQPDLLMPGKRSPILFLFDRQCLLCSSEWKKNIQRTHKDVYFICGLSVYGQGLPENITCRVLSFKTRCLHLHSI